MTVKDAVVALHLEEDVEDDIIEHAEAQAKKLVRADDPCQVVQGVYENGEWRKPTAEEAYGHMLPTDLELQNIGMRLYVNPIPIEGIADLGNRPVGYQSNDNRENSAGVDGIWGQGGGCTPGGVCDAGRKTSSDWEDDTWFRRL